MENETVRGLIFFGAMALGTFLLTVLISLFWIPFLRRKKMDQPILSEFIPEHAKKQGTPAMGGAAFVVAALVVMLAVTVYALLSDLSLPLVDLWLVFGLAVANTLIGVSDDVCKIFLHKRNDGLSAWQKLLLQLLAAAIYLVLAASFGSFSTVIELPFTDYAWDAGILTYVILIVLISGVVNSVNLTDGIDGLASSVTAVVALFFGLAMIFRGRETLLPLAATVFGGTLGFLCFNHYPAKVFMGDTGSHFLGGMLAGTAIVFDEPFIILIAGGVFVIETVSVMLKKTSLKLVHAGLLKKTFSVKTPLHHHLQYKHWSEHQIVALGVVLSILFCAVAWLGVV